MLKAAVLVLVVAFLCSHAEASAYKAKCDTFAKCKASAAVKINLKGAGKCEATAGAYCKAWAADSGNCFNKETLYINLKKCREIDVAIDAKCWAKAAAKAFAKAAVETKCIGGKPEYTFACGKADAEAIAIACAVAEAVVKLSVSVGGHPDAVCEAEVAAAIDAIAAAAASASAENCSKSGQAGIDKEEALAKAIEKVIVKVFAKCWVYCKDGDKVAAGAVAEGGAVAKPVKTVEKEKEIGGANADAKTGGGHK